MVTRRYHVECFESDGHRIGGFVVMGTSIADALSTASRNIELAIRPDQYQVTVTQLPD